MYEEAVKALLPYITTAAALVVFGTGFATALIRRRIAPSVALIIAAAAFYAAGSITVGGLAPDALIKTALAQLDGAIEYFASGAALGDRMTNAMATANAASDWGRVVARFIIPGATTVMKTPVAQAVLFVADWFIETFLNWFRNFYKVMVSIVSYLMALRYILLYAALVAPTAAAVLAVIGWGDRRTQAASVFVLFLPITLAAAVYLTGDINLAAVTKMNTTNANVAYVEADTDGPPLVFTVAGVYNGTRYTASFTKVLPAFVSERGRFYFTALYDYVRFQDANGVWRIVPLKSGEHDVLYSRMELLEVAWRDLALPLNFTEISYAPTATAAPQDLPASYQLFYAFGNLIAYNSTPVLYPKTFIYYQFPADIEWSGWTYLAKPKSAVAEKGEKRVVFEITCTSHTYATEASGYVYESSAWTCTPKSAPRVAGTLESAEMTVASKSDYIASLSLYTSEDQWLHSAAYWPAVHYDLKRRNLTDSAGTGAEELDAFLTAFRALFKEKQEYNITSAEQYKFDIYISAVPKTVCERVGNDTVCFEVRAKRSFTVRVEAVFKPAAPPGFYLWQTPPPYDLMSNKSLGHVLLASFIGDRDRLLLEALASLFKTDVRLDFGLRAWFNTTRSGLAASYGGAGCELKTPQVTIFTAQLWLGATFVRSLLEPAREACEYVMAAQGYLTALGWNIFIAVLMLAGITAALGYESKKEEELARAEGALRLQAYAVTVFGMRKPYEFLALLRRNAAQVARKPADTAEKITRAAQVKAVAEAVAGKVPMALYYAALLWSADIFLAYKWMALGAARLYGNVPDDAVTLRGKAAAALRAVFTPSRYAVYAEIAYHAMKLNYVSLASYLAEFRGALGTYFGMLADRYGTKFAVLWTLTRLRPPKDDREAITFAYQFRIPLKPLPIGRETLEEAARELEAGPAEVLARISGVKNADAVKTLLDFDIEPRHIMYYAYLAGKEKPRGYILPWVYLYYADRKPELANAALELYGTQAWAALKRFGEPDRVENVLAKYLEEKAAGRGEAFAQALSAAPLDSLGLTKLVYSAARDEQARYVLDAMHTARLFYNHGAVKELYENYGKLYRERVLLEALSVNNVELYDYILRAPEAAALHSPVAEYRLVAYMAKPEILDIKDAVVAARELASSEYIKLFMEGAVSLPPVWESGQRIIRKDGYLTIDTLRAYYTPREAADALAAALIYRALEEGKPAPLRADHPALDRIIQALKEELEVYGPREVADRLKTAAMRGGSRSPAEEYVDIQMDPWAYLRHEDPSARVYARYLVRREEPEPPPITALDLPPPPPQLPAPPIPQEEPPRRPEPPQERAAERIELPKSQELGAKFEPAEPGAVRRILELYAEDPTVKPPIDWRTVEEEYKAAGRSPPDYYEYMERVARAVAEKKTLPAEDRLNAEAYLLWREIEAGGREAALRKAAELFGEPLDEKYIQNRAKRFLDRYGL
ncbi:MAG: hypothetical protein QXY12_03520 [Pyrobaculum sp.]